MACQAERNSFTESVPLYPCLARTHTSTRLHVDRMTPSAIPSRSTSPRRAVPTVSAGKASRSRTSTGALRWFSPTMTMSPIGAFSPGEVRVGVEPRQQEVHTEEGEHDRAEPHDGEDGRLPS